MSLVAGPSAASSSSLYGADDDLPGPSWSSSNEQRPIPWASTSSHLPRTSISSTSTAAGSSSTLMYGRTASTSAHKLDQYPLPQRPRPKSSSPPPPKPQRYPDPPPVPPIPDSSMARIKAGACASRSRVSLDARPADEEGDYLPTVEDDEEYLPEPSEHLDLASTIGHESITEQESINTTISQTSSSASLPDMADHPPAPPPFQASTQAASVLGTGPVGLGLPTYIGCTGRADWPVVRDLADEASSDDEDDIDIDTEQVEMDTYQSTYRAPVDAALRSMPGVVGLGDGWAGGPQTKPKRTWFKRTKSQPDTPDAEDPLALWQAGTESPVTSPVEAATPTLADPNAKWWRSRRNLFTSQKNLSASAGPSQEKSRPSSKARGWVNRSRLNFGSVVDLARSSPKKTSEVEDPMTPTCATSSKAPSPLKTPQKATPKRHSVAAFLRHKPHPHPLELSHGKAAAHSQPLVYAHASTSQPSLATQAVHQHPMLRHAYARSESNLAGAANADIPPRPAPLIINGGPSINTSSMPLWRDIRAPPRVSPTPLLEVEEEDEEETSAESDRPELKRTATFGDDEEAPDTIRPVAQAPRLSPVAGSPHEVQRTLSITTSAKESTKDSVKGSVAPTEVSRHTSLLGRIKNKLTRGRRIRTTSISAPIIPPSPSSVQSEQPVPTTPTTASTLAPPRSLGRSIRAGSKIFGRRRASVQQPEFDLKALQAEKAETDKVQAEEKRNSYRVSRHVVASMMNLASPGQENDVFQPAPTSPKTPSGSSGRSRASWASPLPSVYGNYDTKEEQPRRGSRITLLRKSNSKQRPPLGSVFPRPPENVQQPPSLHWAFPGSYSTPMLHKFGGSTLSLALDISAEANTGLADIEESPTTEEPRMQRERAISATIAALTSRSDVQEPATDGPRRRSIPINIDNLATSSADSLTLASANIVDFPLPPSSSSGDVSSPDNDNVEQLCTPRDSYSVSVPVRQMSFPTMPAEFYRSRPSDLHTVDSISDTSNSTRSSTSAGADRLRKQPSWSTCKTSVATPPLATPTSVGLEHRQDFPILREDAPYMKRASLRHPIVA